MSAGYLWVKALHIVFVASWFAGLFYLPRLFVNLASVAADSHAERERLLLMARRLFRFSGMLMVVALASAGRPITSRAGVSGAAASCSSPTLPLRLGVASSSTCWGLSKLG